MNDTEAQATAGAAASGTPTEEPKQGTAAPASQPPGIPKRRSKFSSAPPPGIVLQQAAVPVDASAQTSAESNTSSYMQQQQPNAQAGPGAANASQHDASGQPPGYGVVSAQQPWAAQVPHQAPAAHPALHPLAQPQATPLQMVSAPSDAALALRITKLAEFTTRNGPAFENQVREKQGANPEYAFLNAGEGSDYYQWCLFTMARQLPLDQPLPEGWTDPLAHSQQGGQAMPQEVASGFAQVLQMLQGTQDSIKASSAWFLACNMHAQGMAAMMLQQAQQLPAFTPQLHLLYLINDIFFSGVAEPQSINAHMAAVFQPLLSQFFTRAYTTAQRAADAHGQLVGLLDLWAQRGVYTVAYVESVKADMLAQGPPIVMPPDPAHAIATPSAMWSAAHPHGSQGGYGAAPPHWGSPGLPANAPPPDLAGIVPLSEQQPYDILSFPAGLIPKLVKHSLKYEREYTPLPQGDIEREPPPERPKRDSYLQSRLSRFYAEIAQYRPGQNRAAYEETLRAMGDGLLPAMQEPSRIDNATNAASHETNMRQDGSYAGGYELGRGGVGAHAAADGDGDAFARYRQQRSGRYHTIMATKSTNPNRPPMGH